MQIKVKFEYYSISIFVYHLRHH